MQTGKSGPGECALVLSDNRHFTELRRVKEDAMSFASLGKGPAFPTVCPLELRPSRTNCDGVFRLPGLNAAELPSVNDSTKYAPFCAKFPRAVCSLLLSAEMFNAARVLMREFQGKPSGIFLIT